MRVHIVARITALLILLVACRRAPDLAPVPTAQAAAPALPAGVTPQLIARGDSIFRAPNAACQRCHGADATGGANAPSLKTGPWLHTDGSVDQIAALIISGVPRERLKDQTRRFAMNPRGGPMNLSDADARALAAYIWSISRAKVRNGE